MRQDNEIGRNLGQPTVVRGNGQIEFGIDRLVPRNNHGAEAAQAFVDSVDKGVRTVPAEYQLHARVGIENREHVDQPQQRGDVMGDHQHATLGPNRIPVPRL
ncbi:hypothetical protein [Nocardia terpenica]|uniref:hypothetical protein n=1 Tax=Nocardia terpenica TaxID=455432 RepID=UPI001EEB6A29|nr:hypothetical protein [Nocardia terpenica]